MSDKAVGFHGVNYIAKDGREWGMNLTTAVKMFPTPKAQNANSPGEHGQGGMDLQTHVQLFPTPRAGNPGSRPNKKGGKILAEVVKQFPTPQGGEGSVGMCGGSFER